MATDLRNEIGKAEKLLRSSRKSGNLACCSTEATTYVPGKGEWRRALIRIRLCHGSARSPDYANSKIFVTPSIFFIGDRGRFLFSAG